MEDPTIKFLVKAVLSLILLMFLAWIAIIIFTLTIQPSKPPIDYHYQPPLSLRNDNPPSTRPSPDDLIKKEDAPTDNNGDAKQGDWYTPEHR